MSKLKIPGDFHDQFVSVGERRYPVKDWGHIDVVDEADVAELKERGFTEVPTDDAAQRAQQAQQQQAQRGESAGDQQQRDQIAQRNQPATTTKAV